LKWKSCITTYNCRTIFNSYPKSKQT